LHMTGAASSYDWSSKVASDAEHDFQRIGLSATVGRPEEMLLSSVVRTACNSFEPRETIRIRLEWPRPIDKDFERPVTSISPGGRGRALRDHDSLDESRSTLVFGTHGPRELLGSRLAMVRTGCGGPSCSLPREERTRVEAGFQGGEIAVCCARPPWSWGLTSGPSTKVVQYNSPPGHNPDSAGGPIRSQTRPHLRGLVLAVSSDDAIRVSRAIEAAQEGDLEPLHIHRLASTSWPTRSRVRPGTTAETALWSEILKTIRSADPTECSKTRRRIGLRSSGSPRRPRQQGDKVA